MPSVRLGKSGLEPDRCSPRRCPEARGSSRGAGARAREHELLGEPRRGFHEVLAIVEDEERLLLAQIPGRAVRGRAAALHGHPDRAADRLGDEQRILERGKLGDPDAVGIRVTMRYFASLALTSARSPSRGTNEVTGCGRLWTLASSERSVGKRAVRPGATS